MAARDAFTGIRLKRSRAWDQINGLRTDFKSFLTTNPYTPRINFSRRTGVLIFKVQVERTPDPMWGIRVGEVVHNLRSALDHLIWELVILNTSRPPSKNNKNQFPIFEHASGFANRGVKQFLRDVGTKAIDLIKAEQPFPEPHGGTGEGVKSPLWHLHELSNFDKHRTMYITGAMLTEFEAKTAPVKFPVRTFDLEMMQTGPIQQDAIIRRILFLHNPGGNIVTEWPFISREVQGELAIDIAFDYGTPAVGGWLVGPTLIEIANRTDRILRRISTEIFETEL